MTLHIACDNCSKMLEETVVRHSYDKLAYEIPDAKAVLWRYMDFAKYVWLVQNRALYFASAKLFDDPFEGARGIQENKPKWDAYYYDFFKKIIAHPPGGSPSILPPEQIEIDAKRLLDDFENLTNYCRESYYINCWHENSHESEAMWKLYSKDISNAIAIQTTFENLYLALDRNPDIDIGRVNYIDFNRSFSSSQNPFWFKRTSFAHEKEVRAIYVNHDERSIGMNFNIDLDRLIERIYISPYSSKWIFTIIDDINKRYGLDKPILNSDLNAKPFY